ncbi:MAG TPA: hypothetical protein VN455_04855 [Methanotrichaceae archaeon]|nr:hypothetical protein [Methanotrichaceae archaeon]
MGQPSQYSIYAPGDAPTPKVPSSPDSLGLQAPEPISTIQTAPQEELSQPLMRSDESSASSISYSYGARGASGYGQESARLVLPGGAATYNRLYISSADQTTAGADQYTYLPIWLQVYRTGPIWLYEWYPDGHLDVNSLGYAYPGWYKKWFLADTPGWHIMQYYCNGWSNYIYIYVYGTGYSPSPYPGQTPAPYYGTSSVILRSSWFKGYDVYLDGSHIGTEGTGGDPLDGVYRFNAPGNMWHTIVISRGAQSYDETGTFVSGATYRFTL